MSNLPISPLWTEQPLFDLPKIDTEPSEQVMIVFNFWLENMRSNSKTRVVLSDKRRRKIEKAIKLYDVQTCKDAILGCAMSDFHMGRNGMGKKYDELELILRDEEHIERFAADYRSRRDF